MVPGDRHDSTSATDRGAGHGCVQGGCEGVSGRDLPGYSGGGIGPLGCAGEHRAHGLEGEEIPGGRDRAPRRPGSVRTVCGRASAHVCIGPACAGCAAGDRVGWIGPGTSGNGRARAHPEGRRYGRAAARGAGSRSGLPVPVGCGVRTGTDRSRGRERVRPNRAEGPERRTGRRVQSPAPCIPARLQRTRGLHNERDLVPLRPLPLSGEHPRIFYYVCGLGGHPRTVSQEGPRPGDHAPRDGPSRDPEMLV